MSYTFFKAAFGGWLLLALVAFLPQNLDAQSVEKIEKKCKDLAFENRTRLVVGSFKATAPAARGKFSEELATMLSNALVSTECFQVLASVKSNLMDDIKDEQQFNEGENVEENAEAAKMLTAQMLITGEITEFAEGKEGGTVAGISLTKNKARVGFILQIVNPRTRQILFSESINTEAIALGGFSGVRLFGLPAIGSFKTKAMGDAVEKSIIKSVELIVAQKDKMPKVAAGGATDSTTTKSATVTVGQIDFARLSALTAKIKSNPKVKEATKTLSAGTGTIKITHEGTFDELAEYLSANATDYEITGAEKEAITLKIKE
jgi:curli biogenesis system outer membrane secretion channel CsgG